jgi:hypothetical protein
MTHLAMQFTPFEITMGFFGVCLSIVACAAICGVFVIAERNRFERYERLRGILLDICNPHGAHAVKLLAVHELRNYHEYAGVIARALKKPSERAAPAPQAAQQAIKPQTKVVPAHRVQPSRPPVPRPQATRPVAARAPLEPFPAARVANDRLKPAHLTVVATPKRDILEGVIIRERGRPVKGSVLRDFLRFRDAVTDRLIYRDF